MAEVICVGVAFLDYVFEIDAIPAKPTKTFARSYAQTGGGMAATAAVAVAGLGGGARFWGELGDDDAGDLIMAELAAAGVDVRGISRIAGAQSPVSAVLIDARGERLIAAFRGRGLHAAAQELPLYYVQEAGAVLADTRWPEGALAVLDAARAHNVPGVLDADVGPEPVPEALIGAASHVVFSAPGLAQRSGREGVAEGLEVAAGMTAGLVAVTHGGDGFTWREADGAIRHMPALEVEAVDTLGAGDVFHGAYALALAEGKNLEDAARFATIAAGLKCARAGGRTAMPSRAEVWVEMERATLTAHDFDGNTS